MTLAIKTHLAPLFAPLRLCAQYFSTPRARNDYATHVPILIGLARMREIKNVLEFGCGYYSTLTFLNRSIFPQLERLQSVENDSSWGETLQEVAGKDNRWVLKLIEGEIANAVSNLNLEAFDLILIDDSTSSAQRAATIRATANRRPQRPWIVVHDFEVEEYQRAARDFGKRYIFKSYNPQTGLVCNNGGPDIKPLNKILRQKSRSLEPDDLRRWVAAFEPQRQRDTQVQ
jgi:hypothetical protein